MTDSQQEALRVVRWHYDRTQFLVLEAKARWKELEKEREQLRIKMNEQETLTTVLEVAAACHLTHMNDLLHATKETT